MQSKYWQQRFDQIEQAANNKSVKYVKQLEKKYNTAAQQLDKQINAWYQRIAVNNEVTITEAKKLLSASELKEFKWTVEDYIEYGQRNAVDKQWMKELENASAKFHINRLEALKLEARQQVEQLFAGGQESMFDTLADVYKDTFYRSCFEVQKGVGVGFDVSKLDDKQISKLLMKPWSVDGTNFSEKLWGNKRKLINTLDQELSRMVLTGESPQKIVTNIRKAMNTSQFAAKRLVLTEQAYFASVAQKDAYAELDVEEFEFVGTLDGRTCEDCGGLDGQHFPLKEMQPGVNAAPMHPYCRCTTAPYFDDEFTVGERIAKDEDGEYYHVPEKMTYTEWKDSFVGPDGDNKDLTPITPENSVRLLHKPKRPRKSDFEDYDDFLSAREEYKKQKEVYDAEIDQIVQEEINKPRRFATKEAVKEWCDVNDCRIDESVFENVDLRIMDDVIEVQEEMLSRFPMIKEHQDSFYKYGFSFHVGDNSDYLFEASTGLNFGRCWSDYENGLRQVFDGLADEFFTMGDGTIKTIIRHEFGHNVDGYIKMTKFGTRDLHGIDDRELIIKRSNARRQYETELLELTRKHNSTEYGFTNDLEAFAEGFAQYTSDPSSEYGSAFGEFLERWLKFE